MVETLQSNGLWHVTLVDIDLATQAGLNQEDFEQDFGFFRYKGRPVIISHIFNQHLVVSMGGTDDSDMRNLIEGFSKVVGYHPFCKYMLKSSNESNHSPLPTYEWDKVDPNSRYQELSKEETTSDLTRLL